MLDLGLSAQNCKPLIAWGGGKGIARTMIAQGLYTFRPNPFLEKSFLLFRRDRNGDDSPVGDYLVLDQEEDLALSEKKVMNLVMQLNGEDRLIPLGGLTRARLLFHRKPRRDSESKEQIVFFSYTGAGVSRENAILTLEGFDDVQH